MKQNYLLFLLSIMHFVGFCQDTLIIEENAYYGNKIIQVNGEKDSVQYEYDKHGNLRSILPYTETNMPVHYVRFYPTGKIMWEKTLVSMIEEGNSIFYSERGKKIAELSFEKGLVSDTIFMAPNVSVFIGQIEFSSTIYGGMELENGQSNVSESNGPLRFYPFKLVEINVESKTEHHYATDRFGKFFIGTPRKKIVYGFFPANYPIKSIHKNTLFPETELHASGSNAWNLSSPFRVSVNNPFAEIDIQCISVSYAP